MYWPDTRALHIGGREPPVRLSSRSANPPGLLLFSEYESESPSPTSVLELMVPGADRLCFEPRAELSWGRTTWSNVALTGQR